MTLLAEIVELAPTKDPVRALELGDAEWPAMESRGATPEDAEICRLLAVSAGEVGDYPAAERWRQRSRVRGEAVGWPELVAALDMQLAFKALSIRNNDYANGKTLDVIEGSTEAVELIQRLAPVADGPDSGIRVSAQSPSVALIRRFILDKTGAFQLALGQWPEAAASFTKAIAGAEGARGRLKSRGGLWLALYSGAMDAGDDGAAEEAHVATRAVAIEATENGPRTEDVAITAHHNVEVMSRRGRDLLLYEVL